MVDSSVASADTRLRMEHTSFTSAIQNQCTYVRDTVGSLTESVQHMADQLHQQRQDVDHFLAVELKQDMPTGRSLLSVFVALFMS